MRITENRLRQIIRSTLLQESIGKSEYNSYFLLKRVVDWALRNKMGMSGNAQLGDRESSWNEMTQQRYGKLFVVPPIELYDAVRARLLASPKVSAVSMDVEMGGEMSGAFSVGVYGIPGWPSPMTHDDFYQAAQFIKRNPAMADLVAAYEADFGDDSDPESPVGGGDLMEFAGDAPRDDREDRPFELSRGMVFMIIDLILNSAPKGNTSFLINDVDMEIMVFKPSHPIPAGMTMGRLLAGGGMRDTGARRAPDRLSIATPDAVSDDDVNESKRKDMRITRGQLQQIIREEVTALLNEATRPREKVKQAEPPAPKSHSGDALLVFQTDDGYLEYFVGSEENIGDFVATSGEGEPIGLKQISIGTERAWDNYNNGGPHPVAKWLKKHAGIKKILDQEYPDPFGSAQFLDVADWIAEHS